VVFARIWAWLERHQRVADSLVAAPLLVVSVVVAAVPSMRPMGHAWYADIAATLVQVLPLFVRRRWPLAVFAVIALGALVQVPFHVIVPGDIAVLVALYNVVVRRPWRWAVAAGVVTVIGDALVSFGYNHANWHGIISYGFLTSAVWIGARYTRSRRLQVADLEERALQLERERDAQARAAAASERARIARELHDVVAHNVSVMVVQADGGSFALDQDPEAARRAFGTISATGREALAEMRRLLGVLREGDRSAYAPQPGVAQLGELVDQVRAAGLPVELTVDGPPRELPKSLELVVYRVIQESLTNTLKHGGPGVTARARLHYGDGVVEAVVSDDGRGAGTVSDGMGHGLIGLRERVGMFGGDVVAGPRPGGGFEVAARVPMDTR
jgi:signal transduction histidine kinase